MLSWHLRPSNNLQVFNIRIKILSSWSNIKTVQRVDVPIAFPYSKSFVVYLAIRGVSLTLIHIHVLLVEVSKPFIVVISQVLIF